MPQGQDECVRVARLFTVDNDMERPMQLPISQRPIPSCPPWARLHLAISPPLAFYQTWIAPGPLSTTSDTALP